MSLTNFVNRKLIPSNRKIGCTSCKVEIDNMSAPSARLFPSNFRDFAFVPRFYDVLDTIKEMAEPEDWSYSQPDSEYDCPVLKNYIQYTYERIAEEGKIVVTEDDENACWNTGLVTKTTEEIYLTFNKNKFDNAKEYWHFGAVCRRGQYELSCFDDLPEMAHYFDDPSVLIFDHRKQLRLNEKHIVMDNFGRFP